MALDRVRYEYRFRGLGYSWEVGIEEFVFIIEANCSSINFLEGVPASVVERARSAMAQLAYDLYMPLEI